MKILYLNCFRTLKQNNKGQRDWLKKLVEMNDIDVVCLAESSNYEFGKMFPDNMFPDDEKHCWKAPKSSAFAKDGWKFYICSKHPVVFESLDYEVPDNLLGSGDPEVLKDYGVGTMISVEFEEKGYIIMPVHIQFKSSKSQTPNKGNAFYEYGLMKLRDFMLENNPIAVFGDFNNYPDDKSFLALTDSTGYRKANELVLPYTYKNNDTDSGVLIDHAFTNNENVRMEYVPAIDVGFNHHGMLITIDE